MLKQSYTEIKDNIDQSALILQFSESHEHRCPPLHSTERLVFNVKVLHH